MAFSLPSVCEGFLNAMGSWAHYGFIMVMGPITALSLIWRPMALSLLCRGGSKGKSDRSKLIIVMALLGGFGACCLGKFSNLEPRKLHFLLFEQLFLDNLAACYTSNFT